MLYPHPTRAARARLSRAALYAALLAVVAALPFAAGAAPQDPGAESPPAKLKGTKSPARSVAPQKRAPDLADARPAGKLKASGRKDARAPHVLGCANATPAITFGQTTNGALESGDCVSPLDGSLYDAYSFEGAAGQQVTITMTAVSPSLDPSLFDPYLYLMRPGEATIGDASIQDDDGAGYPNPRVTLTLPQSGTYTILANTFDAGQTGSYTLSLTGGVACAPAETPISAGSAAQGLLSSSDCTLDDGSYYDVFTFEGAAGQQVAVSMASGRSPQFDTFLLLVAPDGSEIARDDNGGGGTDARVPAGTGYARLPQTGTYRIVANSLNPGVTGGYTVTLLDAGAPCPSTPVGRVETKNGALESSAEHTDCRLPSDGSFIDVYTFNGTAGQTLGVLLESAAFDAYLVLLAPDGTELAADNDGGGGTNARIPATTGSITLAETGLYTIYANSNGPGQTGAYALSVSASLVCTTTLTNISRDVSAAGTAPGGAPLTNGFTREAGCAAPAVTTSAAWITLGAVSIDGTGAGTFAYTVAANAGAARAGTITVGGQTFTVNQAAASHTISGYVTSGGTGLSGVTVTLANSQTATTTTTTANGFYSFTVAGGDTYTVYPTKLNYSFTPFARTFENVTASQTADFAGTLGTFTISGRAATSAGAPLSGVTVTMSGSESRTATTASDGTYSFTLVPAGGTYTVTPTLAKHTFAPSGITYVNLMASHTLDFTGTFVTHTISGRVTLGGNGFAGVTVTLAGSQSGTATTDANGNYAFASLPAGGNYTVTPSRAHYSFTPHAHTFTALSGDRSGNFTAAFNNYTISGRVTTGGFGLPGVTVSLTGSQSSSVVTDANGIYAFAAPALGSYTVTPARQHYTFAPASRTFNGIAGDQTGADFAGTLNTHTISGRVALAAGAGLSGVTVTLTGPAGFTPQTFTTPADGTYSFTGVSAGSPYTVTPARTHYNFSPASRSFANLSANQTGDFTAALNLHAITGRIFNVNNTGIPGALVTLSGSQSAAATTDENGNFAFTSLPAGGTYTVTPSLFGHTFTPPSRTFSDLGADQYVEMPAVFTTYTISGRVVAKGRGVAGVAVTLAGSQSGQVTTAADGSYSFTVGAGGDYSVSVSRDGYTFVPASFSFAKIAGNRKANFKLAAKSVARPLIP